MTVNLPAYKLEWPPATVDGYKANENKAILVFNLDVTTSAKVKLVVQYVVGRTVWYALNFPANAQILLSFDFRGQSIILTSAGAIKNELMVLLDKAGVSNQGICRLFNLVWRL